MRKLKWPNHADLAIRKTPNVGREEYLDYMTFRRNDRPLFTEIWGPIVGLKEEWEEQGATPAELDFSAFPYRCADGAGLLLHTGRVGGYPVQVIEDTDQHRIWKDELGRTMKLPKGFATLALPMDNPVRTMDDWLKIKPWYEFSEQRFGANWEEKARQHLSEDRCLSVGIPGGFDQPRQLMGEERLCLAYYDDPELVHDMIRTMSDTAFAVLERATRSVTIDILGVHDDMAGKSGPLAGPAQIREFILPYYRRIWDLLRERGTRLFDQDSDGNMNSVIDVFLDAGINMMHPLEPAAGMDVVKVREKYGTRLAMYGGIDKFILCKSKVDIDRELEYKLPPMIRSGGYVIAMDHRLPNGALLENYRYYVKRVWEIMESFADRSSGGVRL
jgi:uroporphyrinogen-III decarboxylase